MMPALLSRDICDCSTHHERAEWLLRCPLGRLVTDEAFIRRWLQSCGFREGLSYLDTMISVLREERREDGNLLHSMAFATCNGRLARWVRENAMEGFVCVS